MEMSDSDIITQIISFKMVEQILWGGSGWGKGLIPNHISKSWCYYLCHDCCNKHRGNFMIYTLLNTLLKPVSFYNLCCWKNNYFAYVGKTIFNSVYS